MSNPYLPVEKVTESLRKTITLMLSFGLAANDKRWEGVFPRASSRIPSLCPTGTKTSACFCPQAEVFSLVVKSLWTAACSNARKKKPQHLKDAGTSLNNRVGRMIA